MNHFNSEKIMNIIPLKANQELIEYVADLLERCKKGDVVAVTVIEEYPEGEYATKGTKISSRTQTAGMLLDAAIQRLNQ